MIKQHRVVITGMGILAANGIGLPAFWDSLIHGRSGIGPITLFDASKHPIQVAGEVKNFDLSDYVNGDIKAKRLARHTQFAVAAAKMALGDAGLDLSWIRNKSGTAIHFGVSTSAIEIIHHCHEDVIRKGAHGARPHLLQASQPNDVVTVLGDYFGIPMRMTISTACAAGIDALAYSASAIREGKADIVIAGGTDAPITALTMASFSGSGILPFANMNDSLQNRPFDLNRTGGLFAEGAAVVILERLEHALARGATPVAEILGHGTCSDLGPRELFEGLPKAMESAMSNTELLPENIDHISAHGPGHPQLDTLECRAIRKYFGSRTDEIPACSIKGNVGNPLAAAGVMQVIAGAWIMKTGIIPPTANLETIDPACNLHHVQGAPRYTQVNHMLVNSHGMGGTNTCLVLGRNTGA